MPSPHISTNFADLLDPRFREIVYETYEQLPDMLPEFFTFDPTNGRADMRYSQVGTLPDWSQFSGTVTYGSSSQGYDTTLTPLEFAYGIQVEYKLFADDQYGIMNQRPKALANSANRTRQKHGARVWNNAFSIDSLFYTNTEAVPLCSNSHTTTSGASTTTGFDNLATAALSATAVAASRISMRDFRGDQAERFNVNPDGLVIPINLFEQAFEIVNAMGKLDTANNNPNVHKGVYTVYEWNYLTDTNNWFMVDKALMKDMLHWTDRESLSFAMAEELDTLIAKWRGYMRYGWAHTDWRFCMGHQVT